VTVQVLFGGLFEGGEHQEAIEQRFPTIDQPDIRGSTEVAAWS